MSETIEMPEMQMDKTLVEHQLKLEQLFSKNQLIPRIRAEFQTCPEFDFTAYLLEKQIPLRFGLDVLVQMALHKRASLPTLVGILYHHFNDAQLTADMLKKAAEADLMDWSPELKVFVVKFTLDDETQAELDKFQFPLPMVIPPQPIHSNRDTGYLLGKGSVILQDNHHEGDVCLDHLNRMNQVKLTINPTVVQMVKNTWRNLDRAKPGEGHEKFERRRKAFAKYDRVAKEVIATLMQHSDHFHLTHRYDKRGRTYCMGYHVTYQGNPWNKACIEFADKEHIT